MINYVELAAELHEDLCSDRPPAIGTLSKVIDALHQADASRATVAKLRAERDDNEQVLIETQKLLAKENCHADVLGHPQEGISKLINQRDEARAISGELFKLIGCNRRCGNIKGLQGHAYDCAINVSTRLINGLEKP